MELVHSNHLQGKDEEGYAKLVFLCMVCSIIVGAPAASAWVKVFGSKPLGVEDEQLLS